MSDAWLDQIFTTSKQSQSGGVVRRNISDVLEHTTEDDLKVIAGENNCHVIMAGGQFIFIFDPQGNFRVII